jgi:hypothetical protein
LAEVSIRLVYNLETGRKDIYIDYESDSDALPIEHEREHKVIIEKLLGKGILTEDELGEVRVTRLPAGAAQVEEPTERIEQPMDQRQENQQGLA